MATLFDKIKNLNLGQNDTRTLPGGDTFTTGDASKMNIGRQESLGYEVPQPNPVQQPNLQFNPAPQVQTATQPQTQTAAKPQLADEDVARLSNSINSIMSGGQSMLGGRDYIGDIFKLQAEQAGDYRANRGLYQMPEGVVLSPEQQDQIKQSADRAYSERFGALGYPGALQANQMKTGYGVSSILSGLPTSVGNRVFDLSDTFAREPGVKNFNIIQNSAIQSKQVVDRLAGGPGSGADDQRLIYLFAKAQDPDSVVREGEYANAQKFISTLPQAVKAAVSRVIEIDKDGKGFIATTPTGFLTPEARKLIADALTEQYKGTKTSYDNLRNEYARQINQITGRDGIGEELLINYEGAYESANQQQGGINKDALINAFKQEGYSDQQIQDFLKSKGLGFNQVGKTTASASNVQDAMNRIASVESGGNYQALGPVVTKGMYKGERALGKYQVMPGNLPQWSREALGVEVTPQQYLQNPEIQDQIVAHRMSEIYKKYGNWDDVASVWFTGKPQSQGSLAYDDLGTTGAEYVRRFNQARTQS